MRRRRPRLRTALYVGLQRYFLTFCTAKRRPLFTDRAIVSLVRDQFRLAARSHDIALLAYCFMPDHVHFLVEGGSEQADAAAFVHQAKQRSAFAYSQRAGGQLWQASYYDRVLRESEDTLAIVRYIFENPIRKGLVTSADEYPFSGSDCFTVDQILDAAMWRRPP